MLPTLKLLLLPKQIMRWSTVLIDVLTIVSGMMGQKKEERPSTTLTTLLPATHFVLTSLVQYESSALLVKTLIKTTRVKKII